MREHRVFRDVHRRQTARRLGQHGRIERITALSGTRATLDPEHLQLPQDVAYLTADQDSSGAFDFMVGYSQVSGPDQVG